MSGRLMWDLLRGQDVAAAGSPAAALVLLALAGHRNEETGQCNPSIETLAKETGLTRRGVTKALERLRLAGLVTAWHTHTGEGFGANRYQLRAAGTRTKEGEEIRPPLSLAEAVKAGGRFGLDGIAVQRWWQYNESLDWGRANDRPMTTRRDAIEALRKWKEVGNCVP